MNILRYIERLHFLIKRKATGSPKELARKLSVSESSLYLIINNMKELGAPIAYNETRKSYIYYPDMEKIIKICTSLGMMEFIENLPNGFLSYLGENGVSLSGGERQRIAIARAMYMEPEILILDEATSALDSNSEEYVQKMIKMLKDQGKTVIIIAHRLSTILNADRIFVLDKGILVEEGVHEKLIRERGAYFQMLRQQYPLETDFSKLL
ncbi:MAG: ATP-binding cassette domain-containing protein [Cyclobacteriaceae bacterium]